MFQRGSNICAVTKPYHNSQKHSNSTVYKKPIESPLTKAQECLLAHGLNFAVALQCLPNGEYISAVKQVCQKLTQGEADELWAESKGFKQLREDKTRVILTADESVAMVVMDKKDDVQKTGELLGQHQTYRIIPVDPTTKQENRLITLLTNIKAEGGIQEPT